MFNFTFEAGLLRWRGYAFFSWCRSWMLWKRNMDTADKPPIGHRVPASRHRFASAKKRRLWNSKPPFQIGVSNYLLYDGFFLLPSCGRYFSISQFKSNLFIFFPNNIYRKEYTTQHDYHEDIPSDIFPYDYRYTTCQKIENWHQNHAQAQRQAESLHNMRPVTVIEVNSRNMHTERAIIENIYVVFVIKSWKFHPYKAAKIRTKYCTHEHRHYQGVHTGRCHCMVQKCADAAYQKWDSINDNPLAFNMICSFRRFVRISDCRLNNILNFIRF